MSGRRTGRADQAELTDRADHTGHADGADPRSVPWVTASAVGQATYCPYQLYLARHGAEREADATAALARGRAVHERWNRIQRGDDERARRRTAVIVLLVLALVLLMALATSAGVGR